MRPARASARVRWGLGALALLLVLGVAVVRWEAGGAPGAPSSSLPSEPPDPVASPASPLPGASSPSRVPDAPAPAEDALSAALNEERVVVPSGVVVEGIERDREWVCAGESTALSARVGGAREPGTVYRWVWPTQGGAELHPGPELKWRAPERAGRYVVRFQACRDLGGRRVGVLAEREVAIDVRACGAGERQAEEPLRIELAQLRQGAFAFSAVSQGRAPIESYAWDFGDGTTATTAEPRVEHAYAVEQLGPDELRSFTVKLRAVAGGVPLEATAFAPTRGQPPSEEPPPVELTISRWRPDPGGNGWRSDVVIQPTSSDISWERLERIIVDWDGNVDTLTRPWGERVHVQEDLGQGGFRGYVTVAPSESTPDVKQILDALYGRDAAGQEVVVRWSPFKREAAPRPLKPEDAPPPPK